MAAGRGHPVQTAFVGEIRIPAGTREFRPDLGEDIQTITTDSGEPCLVCKSELFPFLEDGKLCAGPIVR